MSASDRPDRPDEDRSAGRPSRRAPRARLHPAVRVVLRTTGVLLGICTALFLAVLLGAGIALSVAYPNLPDLAALTDYRPKLPLRVFAADGTLLGEFGEERRNFTPIAQIPKVMQDAVLAIEDSRFYSHRGVDYLGVIRAGLAQFAEARSQGASTITMQVARNFYLSSEKTITRKLYEVLLALKIESQLNKEQILELYMNQIYLGQRAYGFAAASEIYFGKTLRELTVAEAAMLAGLPKAPSAYNPIANPQRAKVRQQHIIDRMLDADFINAEQHAEARAQVLKYRTPSEVTVHAEYVAEAARQLVFGHYGEDAYSRGLHVYLTVNAQEQMVAYRALRKGIMDYERRQFYRGPEAYIDLPADPKALDARIAEALADHPDNDDLRAAVVLTASPRKVVAALQSGEMITVTDDGLKPVASGLATGADPKVRIKPGAIVRTMKGDKGNWLLTQLPEVEGAFISMDPRSGAIRAMVGGFDYGKNKFNHATQAWRQPGSSFKPFIYSAALEKGFTPATVVNDAALFFDAGVTGSQPWEPKNYDGKFEGPMPLHTALAKSKNMVSIRILRSIGAGYGQQWATRFGFEADKHPAYLTMALGAGSVTPLQMAIGYSVFANGGYRISPVLIARITDSRGRLLHESPPRPPQEFQRAIDERNAFVMTSLLQEVTRSGTAARAQALLARNDIYGKTGTTNDSMDAWFAGYTQSVTAVVWIGYDNPRKLGDRETGGGLALPVWIEYMAQTLKGVPVTEPEIPDGVVNIGGLWFYPEYSGGRGIGSVGLEDVPPTPSEEERGSILNMFRL